MFVMLYYTIYLKTFGEKSIEQVREWVREGGRDMVRERGGKERGREGYSIQVEKPLFTTVMAKKCIRQKNGSQKCLADNFSQLRQKLWNKSRSSGYYKCLYIIFCFKLSFLLSFFLSFQSLIIKFFSNFTRKSKWHFNLL